MISISIDVTQIQKERLKPFTRRDGQKAQFLDLVLIETPGGQYGDYMVKQGVTKEERASGVQMPILGNGKILGAKNTVRPIRPVNDNTEPGETSDVPF